MKTWQRKKQFYNLVYVAFSQSKIYNVTEYLDGATFFSNILVVN